MLNVDYILIDWGTTNFRAFAIDENHEVLDQIDRPLGLLNVPDGNFSQALEATLENWLLHYKSLPIYMSGMVGSALGWINVDYVKAPCNAAELVGGKESVALPWGVKATILPGVSYEDDLQKIDVMRGEETQIFGLQELIEQDSFFAILPGTHSKHVHQLNGKITSFSTFMTGELYSILCAHSILGKGLSEQVDDESTFHQGVIKGSQCANLIHSLFSVRTQQLFKKINDSHVLSYLSGLLIGYELKAVNQSKVYLVGGEALCAKYESACKALSIPAYYVNGDSCFVKGLINLKQKIDVNT